jgi:hypothetical protein
MADQHVDTFAKHQVDKPIRVESLVKCKMQDNLEFLQFVKQYWDQHFPGHEYDPVSRRKGQGGLPATGGAAPRAAPPPAARRAPVASNTAAPRTRTPLAAGGGAASAALREENTQLRQWRPIPSSRRTKACSSRFRTSCTRPKRASKSPQRPRAPPKRRRSRITNLASQKSYASSME